MDLTNTIFRDFRLIAAPHTPFHPDGRLNTEAVARQAEHLASSGVKGVFAGGTTGEVSSLAIGERCELAEAWCDAGPRHGLEVIVHVGDSCQHNARQLAEQAFRLQADAVAAYAPHYFKPSRVDELIEFLVPVAKAASDLPFYFYDIPCMTGVTVSALELLEHGPQKIPNLAGLKYSNTDLVQLQQCLHFQDGSFELLFGCDEMLLSAVVLGVRGAVGSTYNFASPLYYRMLGALAAADFDRARKFQFRSAVYVQQLQRYGFLPASKAVMAMLGVDCGPVRPPLVNLSADARRELEKELEAGEFLQEATWTADEREAFGVR